MCVHSNTTLQEFEKLVFQHLCVKDVFSLDSVIAEQRALSDTKHLYSAVFSRIDCTYLQKKEEKKNRSYLYSRERCTQINKSLRKEEE